MAKSVTRGSSWWPDQEATFSPDQPSGNQAFSRPSVTTGAALPWSQQSNLTLGQPRAFHAGPKLVSTITVASCTHPQPNLVQKGEAFPPSAIVASPFADVVAPEMIAGPPISLKVTEGSDLTSQDRDGDHLKQGSLQSSSSQFVLEPPLQNPSGHIITTAQNNQGIATASGTLAAVHRGAQGLPNPSICKVASHATPQAVLVNATSPRSHCAQAPISEPLLQISEGPNLEHRSSQKGSDERVCAFPIGASPEEADGVNDGSLVFSYPDDAKHKQGSSEVECPADHQLDCEDGGTERHKNQRESSKRAREKRDPELCAMDKKMAKLREYQAQLVEHCSAMDQDCSQMREKFRRLHGKWEESEAENVRLKIEVEHLRKNLEVGEKSMMGLTPEQDDLLINTAPKFGNDLPPFEWASPSEQLGLACPEDWQVWV